MSTLTQLPPTAISTNTAETIGQVPISLRLTSSVSQPHAPSLSRQQIIQATANCFRQDGYDGTTIRRIAKELNCAVGSIYRYFADKRDLLSAVTQQAFEPLAQAVQAGQPIEESINEYRRVALADPVSYRLMFWLASLDLRNSSSLPQVIDRIIQEWARQMESSEQAYNTWAYLHGIVTLPPPLLSPLSPLLSPPLSTPLPLAATSAHLIQTTGMANPPLRLAQPVRIDVPQEPAVASPEPAEDVTML